MAMVESTLSSVLKKHEANPYHNQQSLKPTYTFSIQLPGSDTVYKTQLQLQPITLVQDALLLAIEDFNKEIESEGKELVKTIDCYIPRLPKKNGKPKTDMPCLDIHQKLIDIKLTSIAIQIYNPQKAIITKKVSSPLQNIQNYTYESSSVPKKSDTKSTIMVQMTDRSAKSSKKYSEEIHDQQEFVKGERKNECFCSFC